MPERSNRWRLHRAGIVNVYQYEHEVIDLHGGRLLLRGVNGSGKSTAMNMLLPFLVTARQARIDASGEQSGVLRSWMLSGRDDPQPVGYLWLEFECDGRYTVCGCGIKANRSSDSVTTWWFVTERRPEIDFTLVEGKVPLSADALRATLDGPRDEVFNERARRDYRRAVERRLFGGASIDPLIDLLNVVRNPRIGDRIDVDLPAHLVDALPHLSDEALAEAAQPLDDLETHRRNVDELGRTRDAIEGLLDVYRPYAITQLGRYADRGRSLLADLRSEQRRERETAKAAAEAEQHRRAIVADHERTVAEAGRLRTEIDALRDSPTYRDAQQLDDLRRAVDAAAIRADEADRAAADAERAARDAERRTARAAQQLADDRVALEAELTRLLSDAERLHIGIPAPAPLDPGDTAAMEDALQSMTAAFRQRRGDLDDVVGLLTRADTEAGELHLAGRELEAAHARHAAAVEQVAVRQGELTDARAAWQAQLDGWCRTHDLPAPTGDTEAARHDAAVNELAERRGGAERARADADTRRDAAVLAREQARERLAELEARAVPVMPAAVWQRPEPVRLADLVDFREQVADADRAGIEAALEASGLLTARVVAGGLELDAGDLVAIGDEPVPDPLSTYLTVTLPAAADEGDDTDEAHRDAERVAVERLLAAIATTPEATASTIITTAGEFRLGSLRGRHRKPVSEFIGTTSRRAALERARGEARAELRSCETDVVACERGLLAAGDVVERLAAATRALPNLRPIEAARAGVESAAHAEEFESAAVAAAEAAVAAVERRWNELTDELHRTAASLRLPVERSGLDRFGAELIDLERARQTVGHGLARVARSHTAGVEAAERQGSADELWRTTTTISTARRDEHRAARTRLATIEDTVGADVADLLATLATSESDLATISEQEKSLVDAREAASASKAETRKDAESAAAGRAAAEQRCEAERVELAAVIEIDGLVDAAATTTGAPTAAATEHPLADADAEGEPVVSGRSGADGLGDLLDRLTELLGDRRPEPVDAESVRMSLRRRRDSIGAGWDADARQPDPNRPLRIEVHGPTGRGSLVDQFRVVLARFDETNNLLSRKQDDALRGLLQGAIAKELAERVDEARRLVDLMNTRLAEVRTAHDVGVELRWRRSPDLDEPTIRLVELASMEPDLRRADDDDELRALLAARLEGARREHPDLAYRQLIGDTLDYRRWHELSVLLHRGGDRPVRLKRTTPLSEGEKKLVTYLPMFAAVAASCDALDNGEVGAAGEPGAARFVLLDDAFAKVSEDNHAKLFGLIVELDLDLIATSERLWGTHATVPEIAITEVVRDAELAAILLEHYRWDGATLTRLEHTS